VKLVSTPNTETNVDSTLQSLTTWIDVKSGNVVRYTWIRHPRVDPHINDGQEDRVTVTVDYAPVDGVMLVSKIDWLSVPWAANKRGISSHNVMRFTKYQRYRATVTIEPGSEDVAQP
jgi:hypothetical protein